MNTEVISAMMKRLRSLEENLRSTQGTLQESILQLIERIRRSKLEYGTLADRFNYLKDFYERNHQKLEAKLVQENYEHSLGSQNLDHDLQDISNMFANLERELDKYEAECNSKLNKAKESKSSNGILSTILGIGKMVPVPAVQAAATVADSVLSS